MDWGKRNLRWIMGRARSSSSRRVSSSISSSSEFSSSTGASRSSLKSTKPTPEGVPFVTVGPFDRLPLRLRDTTPVPAGTVVDAAPPSVFFLPKRRGMASLDECAGLVKPFSEATRPARIASRYSGVSDEEANVPS